MIADVGVGLKRTRLGADGWGVTPTDFDIAGLRAAVDAAPDDTFNRCNLACTLACAGAVDEALRELAAAITSASSPITAGCVAGAVRDVADCIARTWSLPTGMPSDLLALA